MSGIKSAFTFLSTLPLISLQSEKVTVVVPWIDESTAARAVIDWKQTRAQREEELAGAAP